MLVVSGKEAAGETGDVRQGTESSQEGKQEEEGVSAVVEEREDCNVM